MSHVLTNEEAIIANPAQYKWKALTGDILSTH